MKMKVSDLNGRALDWAVAYVLFGAPTKKNHIGIPAWEFLDSDRHQLWYVWGATENEGMFNPSANWAHGGPLIEEYATQLSAPSNCDDEGFIAATYARGKGQGLKSGDTLLIAFCRSMVSALHQKDEIEIPDELCEVTPCK